MHLGHSCHPKPHYKIDMAISHIQRYPLPHSDSPVAKQSSSSKQNNKSISQCLTEKWGWKKSLNGSRTVGGRGVQKRRNIWLIFLTRFMCRFFELISRAMPKGDYLPMLLHICSWVILFIHVLYYNAPPAVCSHRTTGKNAIYFPCCTRWRQLIMSPGNMKTAGMGPNSLIFMCGIQTIFSLWLLLTHTYILNTPTKKLLLLLLLIVNPRHVYFCVFWLWLTCLSCLCRPGSISNNTDS